MAQSKKADDAQRDEAIAKGKAKQKAILSLLCAVAEKTGGRTLLDPAEFSEVLDSAATKAKVRLTKGERLAILSALGERDPKAEPCLEAKGNTQADPDLRDTETVPLKETVDDYMAREVLPHVPDAWPDHSKTKIGYEVPLNRQFYVYEPPRPLEDIELNLRTLEIEMVERLAEYRNAVITQAVSKGLRHDTALTTGLKPEPSLKPSGIDRIGDIPEHWEIKRLKYTTSTNDDVISENEDPLREVLYVDIGSINPSKGITSTERMVFEDAPTRAKRLVKDGDTIVSTVRTYLRAVAPVRQPPPEMVVSTGFAVIRPQAIDRGYCSWVVREHGLIEQIVANSNGVSYPAINATQIGEFPITLPPTVEQRAIAQYLDQETARIDELVERAETAVERLNEYRTALINAAVTGKIDVREPNATREPLE